MAKGSTMQIKYRPGAFRELRTLPAVADILNADASAIAAAAGPHFKSNPAKVTGGRGRERAEVVTAAVAGMREQARDHVLERAMASHV